MSTQPSPDGDTPTAHRFQGTVQVSDEAQVLRPGASRVDIELNHQDVWQAVEYFYEGQNHAVCLSDGWRVTIEEITWGELATVSLYYGLILKETDVLAIVV